MLPVVCILGCRAEATHMAFAHPRLRRRREAWTMNIDAVEGAEEDSYRFNPWRAPGYAPVVDAWSVYSHRLHNAALIVYARDLIFKAVINVPQARVAPIV